MEKILVGVHWNSREKCWSVVKFKSRKTVGLLHAHMETVKLTDITFKVDLSKKRKGIEAGHKERHTFIVGYLEGAANGEASAANKLKYDVNDNDEPFKSIKGESVAGADAIFTKDGKVYTV